MADPRDCAPRGDPSSGPNLASVRVDILTKEYPPEHLRRRGGPRRRAGARVARPRRHRCPGARFGEPVAEEGTTGMPTCRTWVPRTPRSGRWGSTWRWRGTASGPTWCTRTPGTPTSAGTSPSLLGGMPHVVTAHSLEPMRPWKAEQLGGGYRSRPSSSAPPTRRADAVIAVSEGMRQDVLRSYPADRPRPGQGGPQRHRLPAVAAAPRRPTRSAGTGSTPTPSRSSSSAGSPGRRACPTC